MNPSSGERDEPSSEGSSHSPADDCDRELAADTYPTTSGESPQDTMKRAAAKELIERYFYQLVDGCGNPNCDNQYCASSGETRNLTPNEAAAEAIKLFYKDAKLCDSLPTKVPRRGSSPLPSAESSVSNTADHSARGSEDSKETPRPPLAAPSAVREGCSTTNRTPRSSHPRPPVDYMIPPFHNNGVPLTERRIRKLCDQCIKTNVPRPLIRALGEAFAQPAILARCFAFRTREENKPNKETTGESSTHSDQPKELRGTGSSNDPDKDVDSVTGPGLDFVSCKRAFKYLSKVPASLYSSALVTAVTTLAQNLEIDLRITRNLTVDDVVNCFLIALEVPVLGSSEYLEEPLSSLCHAAGHLPIEGQAKLARMWALHCKDSMRHMLENVQQLITLRVLTTTYSYGRSVEQDEKFTMPTKLMKILYYANMLAGLMEPSSLREAPIDMPIEGYPFGETLDYLYPPYDKHPKQSQPHDPLAIELDVNVLDVRRPHLPFEDFYNEPLSEMIKMDKDIALYKNGESFAFLNYPFILTTAAKSLGLCYDNRFRMFSERHASMMNAMVGAEPPVPFLRLKVRRSRIVDDAFVELEEVATERALDLKKQLVVEFEGEQGVDEGGVSKEFFQLVVEQIFNPDYGMFTHQHDTQTVWFNPNSYETEEQFSLVGIILGLAIYNHVILAVNFPMVLYRKLMGKKGAFEDLADWNPVLYKGLKSMLEYQGSDMEDVFMQTFRIWLPDVFGDNMFQDLKHNGDSVLVNQENKQEFVELYTDFLLNSSVSYQFQAFRRGFVMVTGESPLGMLFRPEEVETLVCGSKKFDFKELEKATKYDGGYTSESQMIKDFWSIVHDLSLEDKRKLLQFATGSDRVPVGGLSHLKLIIARNGPDCDRLPTAHTCFNVLLLPEYESKEKLNDRLMKAISYSKGFGML